MCAHRHSAHANRNCAPCDSTKNLCIEYLVRNALGCSRVRDMSEHIQFDREQLKRLDQESLIELILDMQEQLATQQVLMQQMQEQIATQQALAADAGSTGERQSQQWFEERQAQESAPFWPAAAWGATRAQRTDLAAGGGTGPCDPSWAQCMPALRQSWRQWLPRGI